MILKDFLKLFHGKVFIKIYSLPMMCFLFDGSLEESLEPNNLLILYDLEVQRCLVNVDVFTIIVK